MSLNDFFSIIVFFYVFFSLFSLFLYPSFCFFFYLSYSLSPFLPFSSSFFYPLHSLIFSYITLYILIFLESKHPTLFFLFVSFSVSPPLSLSQSYSPSFFFFLSLSHYCTILTISSIFLSLNYVNLDADHLNVASKYTPP